MIDLIAQIVVFATIAGGIAIFGAYK